MSGKRNEVVSEPRPVGFALEPGETILWQGRPQARALRQHLLKTRWIAAYFVLLLTWKIALIVGVRGLRPQEAADAAILVVQAIALFGLLAWYARALARSTTYTLTNLRLVIRHGIALQASVDIPLRALRSVAVRIHGDGSGDVAIGIRARGGIGYAKLWPHARGIPGRGAAIPMLRGLDDAALLSTRLARLLDLPLPSTSAEVPVITSSHAAAA